jgi:hypothetical protein
LKLRLTKLCLVAVLAIAIMSGGTASAAASPADRGSEQRPVAYAACPWCLPAAVLVVRAAIAVRTAQTVTAVVSVSRYATQAFRSAISRDRLSRAVQHSRNIARHGRRWVKSKWNGFPRSTRACLKGAGLLSTEQIIDGGFVTETEFDALLLFKYPMLPPLDKQQFKAAIDWSEPLETAAAGCVVGWLALDRS